MKNATAIIIGAVIISATVSVVQGQGRFGGGSCKNPVSLHGTLMNHNKARSEGNAGNWICDNKAYMIRQAEWPESGEYRLTVWDIEEGTYSDKKLIEVD